MALLILYYCNNFSRTFRDPEWSTKHSTCSFHTVLSEGCMSLGDALREIDRQVGHLEMGKDCKYSLHKLKSLVKSFRQLRPS